LITRIASNIGALDGNAIPFVEDPCFLIDESYFVQVHTLKKGPDDSLIFFFLSYTNEIPLPNTGFHLYNPQLLTIPLVPQEEARRSNGSSLPSSMTQNRTMRAPHNHHQSLSPLIHARQVVCHGRAEAPMSGHCKPVVAGIDLPAPTPAGSRSLHGARPRQRLQQTLPNSWVNSGCRYLYCFQNMHETKQKSTKLKMYI
jgi:hypothetical protein